MTHTRGAVALLFLSTSLLAPLSAHCRLDSPNGGEVLRAGTTHRITWTELVPHGVRNWDLYYSLNGDRGPWLPLALDLPPTARSYDWRVDVAASVPHRQVRVRVVQDMLSYNYEDASDADLTVLPSLSTSVDEFSLRTGGTQDMAVDAGSAHGNLPYLIVGSASGTSPGLTIGGVPVPLNADQYFHTSIATAGIGPFHNTLGTLDRSGRAAAELRLPPGLPPSLVGLTLHHVVLVPDARWRQLQLVGNTIALRLLP
ncbi:MAG: hypothetical protein AAF628_35610 [Planctomycetota bacterium]